MKLARIIRKNIIDSMKSVIRNYSLSFATISSITITLLVVAISMVISYNVDNFTKMIKKDVTIVVFLDKKTTTDEIEIIQKKIQEDDNISELIYISKQDSAKEIQNTSEILQNIMSNWTEEDNPLQDSFKIKVKNIEEIKTTANKIKEIQQVSLVQYGETMIDQLIVVFKTLERISYIMVVSLVLVTAFLITNTIKLTIYSRKREIEIMRLVGGSNFVIKMPFVIEGMFLGVLGSIIPIIVTVYGYTALYEFFNGQLFSSLIKLVSPAPFVYITSIILLLLAVIVGIAGSLNAVRRYLKI